jgi:hypothetical protein
MPQLKELDERQGTLLGKSLNRSKTARDCFSVRTQTRSEFLSQGLKSKKLMAKQS